MAKQVFMLDTKYENMNILFDALLPDMPKIASSSLRYANMVKTSRHKCLDIKNKHVVYTTKVSRNE